MEQKDILKVLLTEYDSLRDELKKNFDIQIRLYGIFIPALGVAYGLIFTSQFPDLILLIPFILLPLGLRFQHSNYGVKIIGEYLTRLEKQIQNLLGYDDWSGYQSYWKERRIKWIVIFWDGIARWLLFIGVPFGIALLYLYRGSISWFKSSGTIVSYVTDDLKLILVIIYLSALIGSFIIVGVLNWIDGRKSKKFVTEKKSIVFQYGSNCLEREINSSERLDGAARFLDVAKTVGNYKLCFNVFSRGRNGGASDIVKTDNGKVWGVLYEIPENLLSRETIPEGIKSLDEIEGEGINYVRFWLPVKRPNGQRLIALTYVVKDEKKKETQTNFDYAKLIIDGLIEHYGIPEEYINEVKKIIKNNNPKIDVTKL